MKLFCVISIVLSMNLCSCGDKDPKYCDGGWDTRLNIVNNSSDGLFILSSATYPDTNSYSTFNNDVISHYGIGYVNAKSNNIQRERCTWDDYFKENVISDTLMIFLILDEGQGGSLHLDIEKLIEKHTVIKRYDLTLADLENQNWTITYP